MDVNNSNIKLHKKLNINKVNISEINIDPLTDDRLNNTGASQKSDKNKGLSEGSLKLSSWLDTEFVSVFQCDSNLREKDVNNWQALQDAIKTMDLRETSCKGVYCQNHNPDMPAGNYTHQKHFVWDDAKKEMVELPGIYKISADGNEAKGLDTYEAILAYQQGFRFTDTSGIYEKDGQKYKFNIENNTFEVVENKPENDSPLEDPLFVHGYLEPYRDMLYNYNCPADLHETIMNMLDGELKSYYTENGSDGLEEYLDGVFSKLVNEYQLNAKSSIDVDALFGENEKISPKDLLDNLRALYNSDSEDVVQFARIIDDAIEKFNIRDRYDQEDLVKCVFMLMNKYADVENEHPVTLTKQAVENLNSKDFFEQMDNITSSNELRDLYYFGVDGYIDNFSQGSTGDCWLLASIAALNVSEAGRQILKDSISTDEDGNITVTFKGIGISYTITPEEMVEAREANAYSEGDNDVQAIELATEKLRRDLNDDKYLLQYGGFKANYLQIDDGKGGILYGGQQCDMLFYLTGNSSSSRGSSAGISKEETLQFLNDIYGDFKNGTKAAYFALGNVNINATTVDDTCFTWRKGDDHAFAIVGMTEDTVTIVNPWYSDETYTFSWETFAEMNICSYGSVSTKLNEHQVPKLDDTTEYNNTIDYDKKININGQEYSIN